MPHAGVSLDDAARARNAGRHALWARQRADGAWDFPGYTGSGSTAEVVLALAWAGRLDPKLGEAAAADIAATQDRDGAWCAHPHGAPSLGAVARCLAALHVVDRVRYAGAIARARAWLDARGGVAAVIAAFDEADLGAVFLAMAGLADARALSVPPVAHLAVPPLRDLVARRFNAYALTLACELHLVIRRLRGAWGASGPGPEISARAAAARVDAFYADFQNTDGSVNELPMQTAFLVATLAALGRPRDARVDRAVEWLEKRAFVGNDRTRATFGVFSSEVWSTANATYALLHAGVPAADPRLWRALTWLAEARCRAPQSTLANRRRDAPRHGGWAYQRANQKLPDCDDTAVVLRVLGAALADPSLSRGARDELLPILHQGMRWLRGMQNPDGGWAAYTWGLPSKTPGPGPTRPTRLPRTVGDAWRFLRQFPPEFGDPATEGLTGRVLEALAFDGGSDEVRATAPGAADARAVAFLAHQQCESGAWWGRWLVNYLPATACVLLGLAAAGSADSASAARGRRFLLAHQRADGSWGEDERTYTDPRRAGTAARGMPGLTGLVASALLATGDPEEDAVRRAVAWLVRTQEPDGGWPDAGWLATIFPPASFYHYPGAALYYPVEALGRFVARTSAGSASP